MIPFLFNILFFALPFIFLPITSELFEFNKIIAVYIFTVLIAGAWIARIITSKRFIFTHSSLDIPLLLFLLSQILSSIFSIDRPTSIFGYYSRFNGGLLSTFCYVILYWAYVSNITKDKVEKHIKIILVAVSAIAVWASLEHFGMSPSCLIIAGKAGVDCWVQDVQNRVFATLGQPNWLAAYAVAVAPLAWAKRYHAINLLLFATVLFTKSRSGLLAYIVAYIIFWLLTRKWKEFFVVSGYLSVTALLILIPQAQSSAAPIGPALESGGTESGTLRQIVWRGAIDVWRHYPLFGSGVETFAYSYYQFRPSEHNLTSEWDFVYNKAHNEYLNYASNSGTFGLFAYLVVIAASIIIFLKQKNYVLLAGFVSLLITNFFGFSVVITSLLFFIFPALASAGNKSKPQIGKNLAIQQKIFLAATLLISLGLLLTICKYWLADYYYARGRRANDEGNLAAAGKTLSQAISLNPAVAVYYDALAYTYSQAALELREKNHQDFGQLIQAAILQSDTAQILSPRSITIAKARANMFIDLSFVDKKYLVKSIKTLENLIPMAPTDPSIYYRLALTYANQNRMDDALENMQKAIELKANYKNARMALSYFYSQAGAKTKAIEQLEYILKSISPDDELAKKELERLTGKYGQ